MKRFIVLGIASSLLFGVSPSWSQPRDEVRTHEDRVREIKGVLQNYRAPLPALVGTEAKPINNGATAGAPGASRVAAQVVLSHLLDGEMTAAQAWQKKLLSLDDITWILSEVVDAWGGFDWKGVPKTEWTKNQRDEQFDLDVGA